MKKIDTAYLIIFLPTFFILTFFIGFLLLFKMYAGIPEETYIFEGGQPSTFGIFIMGFNDLRELVYMLLLSIIFTFLAGNYMKNNILSNGKVSLLRNGLITTLLLVAIYMVYRVLSFLGQDKKHIETLWQDLKLEMLLLFILYSIVSIPFTFWFLKLSAKSLN